MKKPKSITLIIFILLIGLLTYLAINYKEVKQTFIKGFNNGQAEEAKEEKMK